MPLMQNIKKAFSKFTSDFIMQSKNIPNQIITDSYTSVKESSTISPDINIIERDFKNIFKKLSVKYNVFNKLNNLEKNINTRVNKRDIKNNLYIKEIIESHFAEQKKEYFEKDLLAHAKNKLEELENEIEAIEKEIEKEEHKNNTYQKNYAKILNLLN